LAVNAHDASRNPDETEIPDELNWPHEVRNLLQARAARHVRFVRVTFMTGEDCGKGDCPRHSLLGGLLAPALYCLW